MTLKLFALSFAFSVTSSVVGADTYLKELDDFVETVRKNEATRNGAWLEMENAFDDWEKVMLIFGYADPGDYAACEEIKAFAISDNPNRKYRCNPVN